MQCKALPTSIQLHAIPRNIKAMKIKSRKICPSSPWQMDLLQWFMSAQSGSNILSNPVTQDWTWSNKYPRQDMMEIRAICFSNVFQIYSPTQDKQPGSPAGHIVLQMASYCLGSAHIWRPSVLFLSCQPANSSSSFLRSDQISWLNTLAECSEPLAIVSWMRTCADARAPVYFFFPPHLWLCSIAQSIFFL